VIRQLCSQLTDKPYVPPSVAITVLIGIGAGFFAAIERAYGFQTRTEGVMVAPGPANAPRMAPTDPRICINGPPIWDRYWTRRPTPIDSIKEYRGHFALGRRIEPWTGHRFGYYRSQRSDGYLNTRKRQSDEAAPAIHRRTGDDYKRTSRARSILMRTFSGSVG
jgi:hypothetical protein